MTFNPYTSAWERYKRAREAFDAGNLAPADFLKARRDWQAIDSAEPTPKLAPKSEPKSSRLPLAFRKSTR